MKLGKVVVNVDYGRRMVFYPEGGMQLEAYVDGPGWCLDDDADVSIAC